MAKKELHFVEGEVGQAREAMIALEGPANITADDIEIVEGPNVGDRVEMEGFMAEMVTVMLQPDASEFPEDPVPLGVNGRMIYVWRNTRTQMKRCYVYQLIKACADSISQDLHNDDPKIVNRLNIRPVPRYPFSVIEDTPRGYDWLRQKQKQGG